jgi:hypothetical protein
LPRFEPFLVNYSLIPGRWPLLMRLLFARKRLPRVPGPVKVLRRCLFVNATFDHSLIGPRDLVIAPPPFPGSSFLDFDQHTSVFNSSYEWGLGHIDELVAKQNASMEAMFTLSRH